MIDLREGFSADPNSAVDFPLPHAKMVPYNRHRHAIALPLSQAFFGYHISSEQKKTADRTRKLVKDEIGSWEHIKAKMGSTNLSLDERARLSPIVSRALPIQWVKGDADKAESSFFKINTKGTPLDSIEELLLQNRNRPAAIAARAILRAGKGHKYWSRFETTTREIEELAKDLHSTLFDPEVKQPVKTLDLPLGGPKGVRNALQVLRVYPKSRKSVNLLWCLSLA